MLASDILRGAVVGLVALLALGGNLAIWHVYLASIVFGFVDAFFQPAYTAAVPEITPSEVLPSANSLTSLSGQLAGIAWPALGAAVSPARADRLRRVVYQRPDDARDRAADRAGRGGDRGAAVRHGGDDVRSDLGEHAADACPTRYAGARGEHRFPGLAGAAA